MAITGFPVDTVELDEAAVAGLVDDRYVTSITLPAGVLALAAGTATAGNVGGGRVPAWLFPDGEESYIAGSFIVPASWTAMSLDLRWTNTGAATGDIDTWRVIMMHTDGDSLTTEYANGVGTVTAPAQDILEVSQLIASLAVTAGDLITIRIGRFDGGSTFAGTAAFIGLTATRVS